MNVRLHSVPIAAGRAIGRQNDLPHVPTVLRMNSMSSSEVRIERAVKLHLALVWRVLRRTGLRESDADDAAQDVFWVLSQRLPDVPEAAERSFLVATALRVSSERRRTRWYRSVTEPLEGNELSTVDSCPVTDIELRRRRQLLDEILEQLDPKEREVFVLSVIGEMSKSEIAAALKIPEGTVASRLQRAKTAFASIARKLQLRKGRLL